MRRNLHWAAALFALSGCAMAPTAQDLAAEDSYRSSIPTCSTAKECEAKFAAARNWMLGNCGFRLQTVTADYLETFKSGDYADTNLYCRVTKTPISETAYRIELVAGANNPLMYSRAKLVSVHQAFNDTVNASWQR